MSTQTRLAQFFHWFISILTRLARSSKLVWSVAADDPQRSGDALPPCLEVGEDRPTVIYTGDPYEVLGDYRIEQTNPYFVIIRGGAAIAVRSRLAPEQPIIYRRSSAAVGRGRLRYEAWRNQIVPLLIRLPVDETEYSAELRAYVKAHPHPDELSA